MNTFLPRPMKGETIPLDSIEPFLDALFKKHKHLYASVKHDGFRCRTFNGFPFSSTNKLIPAKHIRNEFLRAMLPDNLDGELIIDPFNFQTTQSGITKEDYVGPFTYHIFDWISNKPFEQRYLDYITLCNKLPSYVTNHEQFIQVPQKLCFCVSDVLNYEQEITSLGHEGIMLRRLDGPYKKGRSTLNEAYLLKLVRFLTAEATIVGTYEQMENASANIPNAFGLTHRSSEQGMKIGKNTLGGFHVVGLVNGIQTNFDIGSGEGWTKKWRQDVWDGKIPCIGKTISYKYKQVGTDKKPRSPIAKGIL